MKIFAIIAGVIVLAIVLINAFGDPERANAREAISLCKSEGDRKSLDPGQARFIAGACEQMEADFQRRFGARP